MILRQFWNLSIHVGFTCFVRWQNFCQHKTETVVNTLVYKKSLASLLSTVVEKHRELLKTALTQRVVRFRIHQNACDIDHIKVCVVVIQINEVKVSGAIWSWIHWVYYWFQKIRYVFFWILRKTLLQNWSRKFSLVGIAIKEISKDAQVSAVFLGTFFY